MSPLNSPGSASFKRKSQPLPDRVLVDEARRRLDLRIDGDDFARSRREHVARRLNALDHGGRIALFQLLPDRRRFGKDDVAELRLRVLADANDAFPVLDAQVFVVLGVENLAPLCVSLAYPR